MLVKLNDLANNNFDELEKLDDMEPKRVAAQPTSDGGTIRSKTQFK